MSSLVSVVVDGHCSYSQVGDRQANGVLGVGRPIVLSQYAIAVFESKIKTLPLRNDSWECVAIL